RNEVVQTFEHAIHGLNLPQILCISRENVNNLYALQPKISQVFELLVESCGQVHRQCNVIVVVVIRYDHAILSWSEAADLERFIGRSFHSGQHALEYRWDPAK